MGRSELQQGTILHFPGGQSYEILGTIGGGGSALLYEGKALNSELRLAIKELYPVDGYIRRDGEVRPLPGSADLTDLKQSLARRETFLSQRAGRRNHQVVFALPPVWHRVDLELPDGQRFNGVENTYVFMESLREKGVPLKDYLCAAREKGGLSLDDALEIMETVLDAYAALHDDGFLHGDCQKGNLFLLRAGERPGIAVIIDFDAAREMEEDGMSAAVTGDVFATDGYCPPELLLREEGMRMSPACDVWALGFLLLELLTDRGMEEQPHLTEYLACHPAERRLSRWELRRLGCTAAQAGMLNELLGKAMALDSAGRYANAGEMREALLALRRCRTMDLRRGLKRPLLWEAACRSWQSSGLRCQPDEAICEINVCRKDGERLEQALETNRSVYFSGHGGGGKTWATAKLIQTHLERGERIPLYLDLAKDRKSVSRQGALGICMALSDSLFGSVDRGRELERFLKEGGCPTLLVADHFHVLTSEERRRVLEALQVILDTWIDGRILLIGRSGENPGMNGAVTLGAGKLTEGCWFAGAQKGDLRPERLAEYFLHREYQNGDGEIHRMLLEQLPALAEYVLRSGKTDIDRAELTAWLRRRKENVIWEETIPERFIYHGTQRLNVLQMRKDALYFCEDALPFFAAMKLAQLLREALFEQRLSRLAAWDFLLPEEIDLLWPVLCAGEVGENGYRQIWPLRQLFERLYALLEGYGGEAPDFVCALAHSAARFCKTREELRGFAGCWEELAAENERCSSFS